MQVTSDRSGKILSMHQCESRFVSAFELLGRTFQLALVQPKLTLQVIHCVMRTDKNGSGSLKRLTASRTDRNAGRRSDVFYDAKKTIVHLASVPRAPVGR